MVYITMQADHSSALAAVAATPQRVSVPRAGKLRRPAVIMFDLDGTLIDTMSAFADLAADMMALHHGDDVAFARARYLETSGIPFRQQLEVIHPGHPANDLASSEFERRKRRICDTTSMDPRTLAGLYMLRREGIKLVVSSNTGQVFVDEFVARESFAFDLALGYDPVRGLAKGIQHVAQTMAEFGITPLDILFVGDSLKDAELALASGVAFVGRLGTFRAEDFERAFQGTPTVHNVFDLHGLL